MFNQLIDFILVPEHTAQIILAISTMCSGLSALFGLFKRTTWLSKVFGTVAVADIGRVFRYAGKAWKFWLKWREAQKIINGALLVVLLTTLGCAATFEESSGKIAVAGARKAADTALCQAISGRARWEKALAEGGAALTGATGIAAWPVEGKSAELALAIGSTVLASGTVLVLTLYTEDAAQYIEAGCATPKGQIR